MIALDFLRFLWKRDSESAAILVIGLSQYLTYQDMRELSDYLDTLRRSGQ